ncbi:hypothetical protein pb186bvf_012710 [Paramecium bursaria]
MDQQSLGDLSSNQQSSTEKKKLKIKFNQNKMVLDQTDCEQKHVIRSQREYDQALEQMFKSSVKQGQSNQKLIQEKQSKKQVQQFDQEFGQQQIDRDSSPICQTTPHYTQLTTSAYQVPHFQYDDWSEFFLSSSYFKAIICLFNKNVWLRLVSYDDGCTQKNYIIKQPQVNGVSLKEISIDNLIHLLMITTHIGISSSSNQFDEEQNIIQMELGTFTSTQKHIYQQLLNVANGMTPEGKICRDKGSSRIQLKIVGEIKNKDRVEITEFIIGGQNSREKNKLFYLGKIKHDLFGQNLNDYHIYLKLLNDLSKLHQQFIYLLFRK